VAVTDDGHPVATAMLMRRALEYTSMFHMPVIEHCEEQTLKADGVAHEGFQASALGLRGIPGEAESIMALRDIALAELTRGATHHAPHHYDEKQVEFDRAPFGITGLETAVSLCFDRLVHRGLVPVARLVELLSINPARIMRVPGGSLAEGMPADMSILAPDLH